MSSDEKTTDEIKANIRNRKLAYLGIGLIHPILYTFRNRSFFHEPALKSYFIKEIGIRSFL